MRENREPWPPPIKQFDEQGAKELLKTCPKKIRDYVKLLQQQIDNWKDISHKAIAKLREK